MGSFSSPWGLSAHCDLGVMLPSLWSYQVDTTVGVGVGVSA